MILSTWLGCLVFLTEGVVSKAVHLGIDYSISADHWCAKSTILKIVSLSLPCMLRILFESVFILYMCLKENFKKYAHYCCWPRPVKLLDRFVNLNVCMCLWCSWFCRYRTQRSRLCSLQGRSAASRTPCTFTHPKARLNTRSVYVIEWTSYWPLLTAVVIYFAIWGLHKKVLEFETWNGPESQKSSETQTYGVSVFWDG